MEEGGCVATEAVGFDIDGAVEVVGTIAALVDAVAVAVAVVMIVRDVPVAGKFPLVDFDVDVEQMRRGSWQVR